jgi:hypothetical protein
VILPAVTATLLLTTAGPAQTTPSAIGSSFFLLRLSQSAFHSDVSRAKEALVRQRRTSACAQEKHSARRNKVTPEAVILSSRREGWTGSVYLARDSKLERDIAIKVLPAHLTSEPLRLAAILPPRSNSNAQSGTAKGRPGASRVSP